MLTSSFSEGETFSLSDNSITDYRDYIRLKVSITSPYYSSPKMVKVRIYDAERIDDLLEDTYHKPTYKSPVGTLYDDEIWVYTGDGITSIGNGELVYINNPVEFDLVNNGSDEYEATNRVVNLLIDMTIQNYLKDEKLIEVKSN